MKKLTTLFNLSASRKVSRSRKWKFSSPKKTMEETKLLVKRARTSTSADKLFGKFMKYSWETLLAALDIINKI